jgi:hypothetical protein
VPASASAAAPGKSFSVLLCDGGAASAPLGVAAPSAQAHGLVADDARAQDDT